MKPTPWKDSFHPYAMTTILCWSLAFIFTKLAMQHFSPYSLGLWRYAAASAALLPVAIRKKLQWPRKKDAVWFLLSGALGFFLYMIVFNIGNSTVTAATASLVLATTPVLTALMARLFFKERLRGYQWLAVGVEFSGILLLTLLNGTLAINEGVLWLFAAALSLSLYNLIQRRLTKIYSPLQAVVYSIFAGTLMLCIFLPLGVKEAQTAPPVYWLYVALLGVLPSALAYVTWSVAFQKALRTSYVSNYMFITPFLSSAIAFLIAGEVPDKATLIGGAVILSGMVLFNKQSLFQSSHAVECVKGTSSGR